MKKTLDNFRSKDWSKFAPISQEEWDKENIGLKMESRSSLGDYKKSVRYNNLKTKLVIIFLAIVTILLLGYAMVGDQESLKAGLIH